MVCESCRERGLEFGGVFRAFAKGEKTFGQRCHALTREVFSSLMSFAKRLFAGGYSCEQVVEALMPA